MLKLGFYFTKWKIFEGGNKFDTMASCGDRSDSGGRSGACFWNIASARRCE